MKQLVRVLTQELRDYERILDVGTGTGRFAKPLQTCGFRVVGVDIAGRMLSKARERKAKNLLRGDACFLPFKDGAFDATVCIHLLHLINEWKQALIEICRVTQDVLLSYVYATENPVQKSYNRLLKEEGRKLRRLGKGETELKKLVKPSKSVFIVSYQNKADELLDHLAQRAYSSQRDIPEGVNERIVGALRRKYTGKEFPAGLRMLMWDIRDLRSFCKTPRSTRPNL